MVHSKSVLIHPSDTVPSIRFQRPAQRVAEMYSVCRRQTESLTQSLSPEDQMVQSCADASPVKWHLAHTAWFFETFVLNQHLPGYRPIDSRFRDLFNSYYNTIGQQPEKALRSTFSRPGLDEVWKYRRYVDRYIRELLESGPVSQGVLDLIVLGINHEQQHQELLITDIKHAFWSNPLRPTYQNGMREVPSTAVQPHTFRDYTGGLCEVGTDTDAFHFDNESPRHKVFLEAFRLGSRLATCGEFLGFIEDDGYSRPELWLSDGWKAVQAQQWQSPLYWEKSETGWKQFTSYGLHEINNSEPVCHVSYYEADAFARWSGARLPTEFEWERAAADIPVSGNLLEEGRFHPQAAAETTGSSTQPGQMFGDVWEWTASAYLPYPRFRAVAGALGEYNGKFMSNQMVLRGGSCATPRSHVRPSYRNFFPPETRWQFSGIRLANDCL